MTNTSTLIFQFKHLFQLQFSYRPVLDRLTAISVLSYVTILLLLQFQFSNNFTYKKWFQFQHRIDFTHILIYSLQTFHLSMAKHMIAEIYNGLVGVDHIVSSTSGQEVEKWCVDMQRKTLFEGLSSPKWSTCPKSRQKSIITRTTDERLEPGWPIAGLHLYMLANSEQPPQTFLVKSIQGSYTGIW